uniref:EF-hand domain-containing protein n=1 Tax=Aureoumbra lagunensis TaxID=44058 RepID=A0A7S3NGK9_9STRA
MRIELEARGRDAACWALVRLFGNNQDNIRERLTSPGVARVVIAAISDRKASAKVHEAGLVLLRLLVLDATKNLGKATAGWLNALVRQATSHVITLLIAAGTKPDAVRAQAADCIASLYCTNSARRRVALGAPADANEEDDSQARGDATVRRALPQVELLPGEHYHLVYGTTREYNARRNAISSADNSNSVIHEPDENNHIRFDIAEVSGGIKTPSKRIYVMDAAECASITAREAGISEDNDDARMIRKRRDPRIVRQVFLSSDFELSWESRDQATGRIDRLIGKQHRKNHREKIPERYEKIDCADIIDCHAIIPELLTAKGLPQNRRELDSCFVLRMPRGRTYILAAVREQQMENVRGLGRAEIARDLRTHWIRTLLQARSSAVRIRNNLMMEHSSALTPSPQKSVAQHMTNKVSKMWKAMAKISNKDNDDDDSTTRLSPSKIKQKRMNSITPRVWEDLVSAWTETPERYGSHPDVLRVLLEMAALQSPLASHAVAALLNLCLHPRVTRYIRDRYQRFIVDIVCSVNMASTARDIQTEKAKFEFLFVLNQLDLIEKNLFRLTTKVRKEIQQQIVRWRRYLGHTPCRRVIDMYDDRETLRKLQQVFADIDTDVAGKISYTDVQNFFRDILRIPLSEEQLLSYESESEEQNNMINLDEFLVLIKNTCNMKTLQARLGISSGGESMAAVAAGAVANYVSNTFGLNSTNKQKEQHASIPNALEEFREQKQYDEECRFDIQIRQHQAKSIHYRLDRKFKLNRWHLATQEAFDKVKHASLVGRVTLDGAYRLLKSEPSLLEALGFVYKDPAIHLETTESHRKAGRRLKVLYESSLERAANYDILCACAEELELDIRTELDYPAFENAIWQISSSFRSTENLLEAERQRRQQVLDNGGANQNKKFNDFFTFSSSSTRPILKDNPVVKSILSVVGFDMESFDTGTPEQYENKNRHKVDNIHEDIAFTKSTRGRDLRLHRDGSLYIFS